jgi:hypothetical protein
MDYVDIFLMVLMLPNFPKNHSAATLPKILTTGHVTTATCNIHPGVPRSHLKTRRMRKMVAF